MFSTRMIEASTIAPIATASPPSDMMFAVSPWYDIGMKARSTPTGIIKMGMRALRTWRRKTKITNETISISSISARRSVVMAPSISSDRS